MQNSHGASYQDTWPLESSQFKDMLSYRAHKDLGTDPTAQMIDDAIATLKGKAKFEGETHEVAVRLAHHSTPYANKIYLDLADPAGTVVEIDSTGWRPFPLPPVYFVRPTGMLPLPNPVRGGKLEELRELLNIGDEQNWKLVVAWLLDSLRPWGSHSVMVLHGEQGAAKTTTAKGLRSLIDPTVPLVRRLPKSEEDLALAASRNWIITRDNLSKLSEEMSDALCRLATGAGLGQRKFYGQTEEVLFEGARPILLNGITIENANRPDLRQRSVLVEVPIPNRYRPQKEIEERLREARPRILGVLLDAVVTGLARLGAVTLDNLPRMADTAQWVEACSPALGWRPGEFISTYRDMQKCSDLENGMNRPALPVLDRLLQWERKTPDYWEGSPTDLLSSLESTRMHMGIQRPDNWPKTPEKLSAELKRQNQILQQFNIRVVRHPRQNTGAYLSIRRGTVDPPAVVQKVG
jgi:hypothetical protein